MASMAACWRTLNPLRRPAVAAHMPSPARIAPLALLFPIVAFAQQPAEVDESLVIGRTVEQQLALEVTTRLSSHDLKTVAWGAWLAARHRVGIAVPQLRERLASLADVDARQRRFAVQALLDALVQNDARLPAAEITPFATGIHEAPAFVLLARDAKAAREFLLARFAEHDEKGRMSRWLASGNLLASIGDREFARRLARSLDYRLEIAVYDVDSEMVGGAGGRFGGRFAGGRLTLPRGYPPVAIYTLVAEPRAGDVLFAAGARPAYWRRKLHEGRKVRIGAGEPLVLRGRQQQRVRWLDRMIGVGDHVHELRPTRSEWLQWSGARQLQDEVDEHRNRITEQHARLLRSLVRKGWLADGEVGKFAARVEVVLQDLRAGKHEALPEIR